MGDKVSVIIPAYNASLFLEEAVRSVLAQSYQDFDLIVVNDGSTDTTPQILERLANEDSRLKVYHQENIGVSRTRNRAMDLASTEWVFLMDADDVMLPHRIESQLAFLAINPDLRAASCRACYINAQGRILGKTVNSLKTRAQLQDYLKQGDAIGILNPGAVIHRPTFLSLGGYRTELWAAEDIDLWVRMAEKGHVLLVQDEVLMHYRIHGGSVTSARFKEGRLQYDWVRACMQSRRQGRPEPSWEDFLREWQARPCLVKLNAARKLHAKRLYREAGFAWASQNIPSFALKLLASVILQPLYTLPRLVAQRSRNE